MSAPGFPHSRVSRQHPQRLRDILAGLRADLAADLERTVFVASLTCESCGLRPSTAEVLLPDVPPFAVCGDCAPVLAYGIGIPLEGSDVVGAEVWTARPGRLTVVGEPMPTEPPSASSNAASQSDKFALVDPGDSAGEWRPRWDGDVPPGGWSGRIRLPVCCRDIVTSVGLLALVAISTLATYWLGGRDRTAFVHMVLVGVAGFLITAAVDSWLLGRRDRRRVARILADRQVAASPRGGGGPSTAG
ncbi:hypothetical protein [Kineosporia sp. R_H_3]|uniref:hypothetical protein n=1 Tax=Kineosporia sp. R_H_3 TaxID=1961848 RepID=UPI000B4A55EB|nr:hypothetical protein [Kineosporia sp. R_H_3]